MGLHVTLIHKRNARALEYSNTAAISDVINSAKELWPVEDPQILFKGREIPHHAALASLTSSGTIRRARVGVPSVHQSAAVIT
jgi:hypothetical protein